MILLYGFLIQALMFNKVSSGINFIAGLEPRSRIEDTVRHFSILNFLSSLLNSATVTAFAAHLNCQHFAQLLNIS